MFTNKESFRRLIIFIGIITAAALILFAGIFFILKNVNGSSAADSGVKASNPLQTMVATPVPAISPTTASTPTPSPTPLPTPSPTPEPATAKDISDAFAAAKLPISKMVEYTEDTDPNHFLGRPNQYIQKLSWSDSRLNLDINAVEAGTIEVFESVVDAQARYDYIVRVTKDIPMIQTYNYLSGLYFMRLSLEFTPKQAKEYEEVFLRMTGELPAGTMTAASTKPAGIMPSPSAKPSASPNPVKTSVPKKTPRPTATAIAETEQPETPKSPAPTPEITPAPTPEITSAPGL